MWRVWAFVLKRLLYGPKRAAEALLGRRPPSLADQAARVTKGAVRLVWVQVLEATFGWYATAATIANAIAWGTG